MRGNETMTRRHMVVARVLVTLCLFGGAAYFGEEGKPIEMGLAIVACAIVLAFLNLDRFRSIKGAGFEAQLKEAVSEAYATTEHVRRIAAVLARIGLTALQGTGRFGSAQATLQKHELRDELERVWRQLHSDDEGVEKAFRAFHVIHLVDHFWKIIRSAKAANSGNGELTDKIWEYGQRFASGAGAEFPSGQEIERSLRELGAELTEEVSAVIADYTYYAEHRQFRRPDAAD